jgi:uroporphyrinogen decarboxylase
MNSRERVMAALDHIEPDMVPVDMGSTENTTLCRIAYLNLRSHLGMTPDPEPYIINRMMDSVFPAEDLLKHYLIDFRAVRPSSAYTPKNIELDDGYIDEYAIRWRKASYYFDMVEHPLAGKPLEYLPQVAYADPAISERKIGLREQDRHLFEDTEYCITVGHIAMGPFEMSGNMRGYENFLVDLYTDPKYATALLDKNLENTIGFWETYLDEVGEYVQVVCQGDDLGTQIGPWISPKMYRQWIKPRHEVLFDFIRTKTKAKIFLHSCGSVYDLIPDLIEIGVDALSPVQVSAAKMDLPRLKHDFGKDICFWGGGVDTQNVLPNASIADLKDHVKRVIEIMAPGGGFVWVPVHNIQSDISPEKIDAIYQTVQENRKY